MALLSLEATPSAPWEQKPLGPGGRFQQAPPRPHCSPLIGHVCGDVVGIADRNPSAPHAGGIVRHPGLCYVVVFSPSYCRVLAAAAWRGVSAAAAVAAAMVSPVTVVSERASERASVWRGRSPPAWGLGCCQPSHGGPRKGRGPSAAGDCCQGPRLLRPAMPFLLLAPPVHPPARGREGHSGHVTRKRDFVDLCASAAVDRVAAGQKERAAGSAWEDHRETWERARESRRVTGTSWESCPKFVSSASSFYKQVWGGGGYAPEYQHR